MIAPGQIIAQKYRVERLLGQGGMGSVWVATNLVLQKPVALKVMSDAFLEHGDWVERFFREGVSASKAKHPGVVQVYDAGTHEGAPWMAMELLEGESLGERLARLRVLGAEETVRILAEVLDALSAVHGVGIVHRDLKPDNIFLEVTPAGERCKVLDFGIAKEAEAVSALTATGTIVGTAHYLAPEQARDSKLVDARTDLYAIGVILFECLSGHTPYQATTVPELIAKMYSEPPRDLMSLAPSTPRALADVVLACLAREPDHRPPNARALANALRSAVVGAGVPMRATGPVAGPSPAWAQAGVSGGLGGTAVLPSSPGVPPAGVYSYAPASTGYMAPAPRKKSRNWPWVLGLLLLLGGLIGGPILAIGWVVSRVVDQAGGGGGGFGGGMLDFDLPFGGRVMLLADVNGDGVDDLVGWVMRISASGGDTPAHVAAYDGRNGSRLWVSESLGPIDDVSHSHLARSGDTLLLANGAGELRGYALADGQPLWHFNLGERTDHFCRSDAAGTAIVVTADERWTQVTLADGTARPVSQGQCVRLPADEVQAHFPGRILEAPWADVDSWDHRSDTMSIDAAISDGTRVLLIGQRSRGTRVPRVGLEGGWEVDVPGVSPLLAEADGPTAAYVATDEIYLAYTMENDAPSRITSFAIADGRRRLDVEMPEASSSDPSYIQLGADRVVVGAGSIVAVFDRASGERLFHIGR